MRIAHQKTLLLALAVVLVTTACSSFGTPAIQDAGSSSGGLVGQDYIPNVGQDSLSDNRIVVRFRPGTTPTQIAETHRRAGGTMVLDIPRIGWQAAQVDQSRLQAALAAYRSDPNVQTAEIDGIAYALYIPNDPMFSLQYGLDLPDFPEGWDAIAAPASTQVAVLDTGVSPHPDLGGRVVANVNFTDSGSTADAYGHGTHVAGIAGALTNNALGVAGAAAHFPAITIQNVKVLGDRGWGFWSWVAAGIIWAANNGAEVINMSLGGSSPSAIIEDAVNYAAGAGVLLACAAGNSGHLGNPPMYPAFYPACIAVGATDGPGIYGGGVADARSFFSQYGAWVDIGAPGRRNWSTFPPRGSYIAGVLLRAGFGGVWLTPDMAYGAISGTSMATPHVAGLAALLRSQGLSAAAARTRIETYWDPVTGPTNPFGGRGRIDACRAITDGAGPCPP